MKPRTDEILAVVSNVGRLTLAREPAHLVRRVARRSVATRVATTGVGRHFAGGSGEAA